MRAAANTIANVITPKKFGAAAAATMLVGMMLRPMLSNESTADLSAFVVPLWQCNFVSHLNAHNTFPQILKRESDELVIRYEETYVAVTLELQLAKLFPAKGLSRPGRMA